MSFDEVILTSLFPPPVQGLYIYFGVGWGLTTYAFSWLRLRLGMPHLDVGRLQGAGPTLSLIHI